MAKKKFSPVLSWLIINLGALFIKSIGITWRYKRLNPAPQQRIIYAFWHRNLLPLFYLHRNEGVVVLVSQSQDGELISRASAKLGYISVRGSSTRGGGKATRELIKLSKERYLGLTPDGPKGPAKEFKDGIIFLAKATGLPIVLCAAEVNREILFNSWDKFRLPLPFSRISVIYSEMINVDRADNDEEVRLKLTNIMQEMEEKIKIFDRKQGKSDL